MAHQGWLVVCVFLLNGLCLIIGSRHCEQLGFTGLQVCSDCESMAEYVKDQELLDDCKQCCVKDDGGGVNYTSARLEVCPYKLNGLPQIQDFIDKHASRYKGHLKIVRAMGAYPKLVLLNKSTGDRSSVRIDNWKVATIHEYLQDKLQLSAKVSPQ